MFTKDEIASYLETLCLNDKNNAKTLKRLIKTNSNRLFEILDTKNP